MLQAPQSQEMNPETDTASHVSSRVAEDSLWGGLLGDVKRLRGRPSVPPWHLHSLPHLHQGSGINDSAVLTGALHQFCTWKWFALPHRPQMSNRESFEGSKRHLSSLPVTPANFSVPGIQHHHQCPLPEGTFSFPARGVPSPV